MTSGARGKVFRKAEMPLVVGSNPDLSFCEATVLTTAPSLSPKVINPNNQLSFAEQISHPYTVKSDSPILRISKRYSSAGTKTRVVINRAVIRFAGRAFDSMKKKPFSL